MNNIYDEQDTYHIFYLIGQHTELKLILDTVKNWLETRIPNAIISIMLYSEQEKTLNLVSGKSNFSYQYQEALKNLKIGPDKGCCGAAAFFRKLVISENLLEDPNWKTAHALIKLEKFLSCWSIPIINSQGVLYGTFATYYRVFTKPTVYNINLLKQAAALLSLAIDLDHERKHRIAITEKYISFYNYHPDTIFELNKEGYIINTNIISRKLFGFDEKQNYGKHYREMLPEKYHGLADLAFNEAIQGNAQHYEIPAFHASGKLIWLDLTNLPIKQNNKITGVFGIARDITLRRQNQEDLRLLKRGVDASPNGIIITDSTEKMLITYVNLAFLNMTGYTENEVIGENCRFLQGPDTELDKILLIKQAVKEKREAQLIIKNYRKDGSWFWNRLTLGPVFNDDGICTHFLGIQEDITKQREYEDYIKYQYSHDHLTGLPNRQTFETYLAQYFEIGHISTQSLVLFYIDLDDFKPLNDNLGYVIGDQIIKKVSERLQAGIKKADFFCRFAEDEFILLMRDLDNYNNISIFAEEILKLFSKPFQIKHHKVHLSASIGIVKHNNSIRYSSELIHQAIFAMKEAKNQGRNTWHWYEKDKKESKPEVEYVSLRLELMEALEQQQFKLFYQPLINPSTGEVKGLEALIRWYHPQRGYIYPNIFIPLAERTGQIIEIGRWVIEKACMDISQWNKIHKTQLTVSVNISLSQFRRAGFLQELKYILQESRLPPELLKIEVTESMLIIGTDQAIEILKSIRNLGIQVSIDDFGTGYSSLSYLNRLPINQIKLDRSFIVNLFENKKEAAIVQLIINLAHQLNFEVVAEGVETLEQAQILQQQGCDLLQGYFYARPTPIDELKLLYSTIL